ncbi:EAL domain-containing protein [Paenibacillus lupini]|uniref:EAL domain-containing protein n=1 Tax=Paenibacillus lupini TaxID=1450204 RepID=UPI00141D95EC|nr:EAL domain-containing protein [Paenibacillus lupini]NIK26582.1 diguanylate cyclase (GGDEF)-like protein [Paenibacillus lupini]
MKKLRLSIAQKLITALGVLMLLSYSLVVSVYLTKLYDTSLQKGELLAQKQSIQYIDEITQSINRSLSSLTMVRDGLLQMRMDSVQNRPYAVHLLEAVVRNNPDLIGAYTIWEPNSFDNEDASHQLTSSYDDVTGRFIPYVVRTNDGLITIPSVDYSELNDKGDYYQVAKQSKKFTLLDPYPYDLNGKEIIVTSFILPIMDENGQFLGIVGGDISLQTVQEKIRNIRPLNGHASIITSNDYYLANGAYPDLVMKPYQIWENGGSISDYKKHFATIQYTSDRHIKGQMLRMIIPIPIQDFTWHFEMAIPKNNMLTEYYSSLWNSIIIAAITLILMSLLALLLLKKIVLENIKKVIQVTSAVAIGNEKQKLDIRTNDEFETMANHFNRMVDFRKEAEHLIQHQATHDLVTGFPNRYGYTRYIEMKINSDKHVALLYIDLDRFKIINETLDYTMGDLLLKLVGNRIVEVTGESGHVYRFGGDEYVVLLDEISSAGQAAAIAAQILSVIAEPIKMNGRLFYLTASIGMSVQQEWTPETGDRLVKESDIALYVAKKQRNTYRLYSPMMNNVPTKELILENSMFEALESNQFMLHYQPKLEIGTGRIHGVEALLRWKHPEFGMVSPLEFIPIAEKTGFIILLGEWVLRTACRQVKQWELMGLDSILVSVNMSMMQFQQKNIVQSIQSIITEEGVRSEQIELELTESIFMENPEHTLRILHELQELGLQLSLDDFGTGYSSLSYLQNIPIHYLKLDKSFIRGIVTDIRKQMIFKSIIVIAHNLNMMVVTEGVETAEELQIIKEHNCDLMQGYLFSPPVTPERFVELFQSVKASGE